ncbi:hypothetical protein ABL78_4697 [Leptomonas seymouri]|uniref:Uncharacterized protein n=1 Tax=Leptomonas seymouri TaxID=5684 RepID=A0A0N1IK05_LEPSE|nr:hypothetical protein ABL78_4697 [Leptomonas seymouri]|eukprot:KPI86224.1 hypothetical protein ABL78_4697 [Leptomonas seymouri]
MIFGDREPPARPGGRALVPSHAKGGLICGPTGLMPSTAHKGIAASGSVLHRRFGTGVRAGAPSETERRQGRHHLDPHHFTNLSDEAKREEGRYGRAHVASERWQQAAAYYATKQPSVVQPPGDDANLYLKSYYYTPLSKAESKAFQTKRPVSGSRPDAQSTSFQVAEARLRQLEREHPEYKEEVEKVLREQRGDYEIVKTQKKLARKAAVVDYAKSSDARLKQIEATTKYHGAPDLGSPMPSIEQNVPYALDGSHCRKDTQLTSNSHVRLYGERNRCSSPASPPVKACDRSLRKGPAPYDSVDISQEHYPSPPPVGVRQGIYAKPMMVHINERHHGQCGEDADTLALKRARAKSGASQSQERHPDFIFGPGPTLSPPRPTLAQRTEARWKSQEHRTEERRVGKALYPQSHKLTSLW